jgi:small-conductance mechanosensitive channel
MWQSIQRWFLDPVIGKILAVFIGLIIIGVLVQLSQRAFGRLISEANIRYRVRKAITFIGYFVALIMITTIYSNKLGSLNIILGVAGAGIAFSLQEVIVSIAGWFAIIFSRFYGTGDRI